MKPEFSPAMLRLFLHARCRAAHGLKPGRCGYQAVAKRERDRLRRLAGVTACQMDFAWMGRLSRAVPRAALWGALGLVPGDYGITLLDNGTQEDGPCAAD